MFALIDCNNFYASCERVFNPKLIGKAIAILSNNDGCVIARSNEAKAFVPMGAVFFKYKDIFKENNIHVFSSNYPLYGDISNRVMSILSNFSPDIEVYSIDEAFLQFKGFDKFDLEKHGLQMVKDVKQSTQIPISVGIAPSKALSKVANKIAKKFPEKTNSVYVLDTEEKRIKALKWTKIEDVWGIGRQFSKKLIAIDVFTAYDFTLLSDNYVRQEFSVVGLRLKKELEGIPTLKLDEIKSKKNIATTRSFAKNLTELEDLRERVSTFSSSCAEKLRKQKSACNAIMVFVHTNFHKKDQAQYSKNIVIQLPYASNSDITISKYAIIGLEAIFKKGFAYKKAGVIVMGFVPENIIQQNLFENENPKHKELMQTMDALNLKMGKKNIKLASQNIPKTWVMRQENLSKRYTTDWKELLEVE
jgi:DNA polymerase V